MELDLVYIKNSPPALTGNCIIFDLLVAIGKEIVFVPEYHVAARFGSDLIF